MSCNGCRVLRKGCSESCVLRSCLQWIKTPEAQGHATLFLSKFFGRSDLLSFVSAVPEPQRPALFQSLLFEACGRTVNPVNGALGLLAGGNWHVCQAAVETVLAGGTPRPMPSVLDKHQQFTGTKHHRDMPLSAENFAWLQTTSGPFLNVGGKQPSDLSLSLAPSMGGGKRSREASATSFCGGGDDISEMTSLGSGGGSNGRKRLLNLFV